MPLSKPALPSPQVESQASGLAYAAHGKPSTRSMCLHRPALSLIGAGLISCASLAHADTNLLPQITLKYTGIFSGEASDAGQACQLALPYANDNDFVRFKKYTEATAYVDPELGAGCMASGFFYSGYNLEDSEPFTQFEKWISEVKGCPAGYEVVETGDEPMCRIGDLAVQKGDPGSTCEAEPGLSPFPSNPINVATGNKFHSEVDFTTAGSQPLTFARFYNSGDGRWRHSYSARVIQAEQSALVQLEDGVEERFVINGTMISSSGAQLGELQKDDTGWKYRSKRNVTYRFGSNGLLVSKASKSGTDVISRSGNALTVQNNGGRAITVTERADGSPISLSAGPITISYEYDDQGRLIKSVDTTSQSPKTKEYHYEDSNFPLHLTGITDTSGARVMSWAYDGSGRVVSSQGPDGTSLFTSNYDVQRTVVTGPLGAMDTYNFVSVAGVRRVASIEGERFGRCPNVNSSFEYDEKGHLVSKTDNLGVVTKYERGSAGEEVSKTYAYGLPEQFKVETTWHSPGRPSVIKTPAARFEFAYDQNGNLIRRTAVDALSASGRQRTTTYAYDSSSRLISVDGPRTDVNDTLSYAYDEVGNLSTITNALGQKTYFSDHNVQGNPGQITDSNGVVTMVTYSPQGLVERLESDGFDTAYEYDAAGRLTRLVQPDGAWLNYSYNQNGYLTTVESSDGGRIEYSVDPAGNRTESKIYDNSSNLLYTQSKFLSELGEVLRSTGGSGQTHHYEYDGSGNLTSVLNPNQAVSLNAFDGLNRLVNTTDPMGGNVAYSYNSNNQLNKVTDARGVTTQYNDDGLGNLVSLISPDSGTTTFEHDDAGNVVRKTDARGVVSLFTYDALNRLKSVSYPATPALSVQMSYDMTHDGNRGIGRLTAIQDSGGLIGYQYDPRGNLTEQIRSVPVLARTIDEAVGYGYDGSNQVTRIDYPAGFSVHYRRNAGRVAGVDLAVGSGTPSPLATDIQYLPFGPVRSLVWGNGLQLSRTYDQDYRLTFQQTGEAFTTYGYDPNGNLSFIGKSPSESSEYQYDPLDRLIVEADRDVRKAYTYDGNGNRLARTTTFTIEPPRDDEVQALEIASNSNRVSSLNGLTVDRDAAGNTLRQRDGIRYTYDAQGRLKQVFEGTELIADYRYNSLGQRTVKQAYVGNSVAATWTYLYGQAGELLGYSQYGAAGNKVKSQYIVWLDRMPLAALDIAYASDGVSISSLKKLYLHSDHLNTPRLATNDAQEPQWRWDSDAFGVGVPNQDVDGDGVAVDIALRFPGQLYDEHSRLYYNYFRDYDPNTGRYVESDPIGLAGGLNTYSYVLGNPLRFSDPFGLDVFICTRPINVSWIPALASKYLIPNHTWVKTDTAERGMGGDCAVPGQGCADVPYVTEVKVIDHTGQSGQADAACQKMNNVDEQCVNAGLQLGKELGTWNGFNQCQSYAWSLVTGCRTGPQL